MASGRPTWLDRAIGLALARRSLRRTLAAHGTAAGGPFDAVLAGPAREARVSRAGSPRPSSRGTGWSRP
jgi:hypothetical protein